MRVFYGIILIIITLQQLSWGFAIDNEHPDIIYGQQRNCNENDILHTDRDGVGPDTTSNKDNKHNLDNLRGLG